MKLRPDRDALDIAESISKIAAAVLVPIAIAFFGWSYKTNQSQTAQELEKLRIAVGVLKEHQSSGLELKAWAEEVLDQQSSDAARKRAMEAKLEELQTAGFCVGADHPLLDRLPPVPKFEGKTYRDLALYAATLKHEVEVAHFYHNVTLDWIAQVQRSQCPGNPYALEGAEK